MNSRIENGNLIIMDSSISDEDTNITKDSLIIKPYFDKLIEKIQKLRGCSCECSDGIIDDVEDIIEDLLSKGS